MIRCSGVFMLCSALAGCGAAPGGGSSGSGFSISVTSAQSQLGIGGRLPPSGGSVAVVEVSIANDSATPPVLASAPLFSITTKGAIVVPVSGLVGLLKSPCTDLSVAQGGTLGCSLAFEVPKGDTPVSLDYADGMGRSASASMPALTDGACDTVAGWMNGGGSSCTSCFQSAVAQGRCPNIKSCSSTEGTCIADKIGKSLSAACAVAADCALSPACADAWTAMSDCVVFMCDAICR